MIRILNKCSILYFSPDCLSKALLMEEKTSSLKGSQTTLLIFCVILMLFGAVLLFVEYLDKRADMYLLPEGFKGTATIFFNEPSGIPEKREGQQRIFEIPPSGTLHTHKAVISRNGATITISNPMADYGN